jgi:hypothetical protein
MDKPKCIYLVRRPSLHRADYIMCAWLSRENAEINAGNIPVNGTDAGPAYVQEIPLADWELMHG